MSPRPAGRAQPCGRAEARTRLAQARSFAETAELAADLDEAGTHNVVASLAVLAGIAAADAACCAILGVRSRGQDHREAVTRLAGVADIGADMSKDLARLLDIKDSAQYSTRFVSATVAAQSAAWARRMIVAAEAAVLA